MEYVPDSAETLAECVRQAAADGQALEPIGAGSKRGWGRVADGLTRLDVSALKGINLYEPEELILSAGPGTPLADIEATIAVHQQRLAFEPPDYGPLFGAAPGRTTLGGIIGCNASGPARFKAGAARDHILGISAVNGQGVAFRAGGRVVKNVTGFDLCKLLTGSFGTLAVFSELTVKVLPAPPGVRTLHLAGQSAGDALTTFAEILGQPWEVTGAAHVPAALSETGAAVTALRLEGPEASLDVRAADLMARLRDRAAISLLDTEPSRRFWRGIRDVTVFAGETGSILWRLAVPPARAAGVLAALSALDGLDWLVDWGGALIWVRVKPGSGAVADDPRLPAIRAAAAEAGGHGVLFRAPDPVKDRLGVFPAPDVAERMLIDRLRRAFDPDGLFNPGRMAWVDTGLVDSGLTDSGLTDSGSTAGGGG